MKYTTTVVIEGCEYTIQTNYVDSVERFIAVVEDMHERDKTTRGDDDGKDSEK